MYMYIYICAVIQQVTQQRETRDLFRKSPNVTFKGAKLLLLWCFVWHGPKHKTTFAPLTIKHAGQKLRLRSRWEFLFGMRKCFLCSYQQKRSWCRMEILPEAQWTQDIESKTWMISKSRNECKFQFSTLNILPLPGNHLSHLEHLPVILLAHHHLNDNDKVDQLVRQHILSPTWSQLTSSNIPCSSYTTTLPTPLVISKPTLGSTTIY